MLKKAMILGMVVGMSSAGSALAGDAAAGAAKSAVCAACHGANGIATIKTYPNLAGQNKEYLISSLNTSRSNQPADG